jgi:hypothetical protein
MALIYIWDSHLPLMLIQTVDLLTTRRQTSTLKLSTTQGRPDATALWIDTVG